MFRKHPNVSAYDEGEREADAMLTDIMAGGYVWRGYASEEEAIEGYCSLAEQVTPVDDEHEALISGYLGRFRRGR